MSQGWLPADQRRAVTGFNQPGMSGLTAMQPPTDEQIKAMTPRQRKSLENRARLAADRQGLRVRKSQRRDPRALDYGRYTLADSDGHVVTVGTLADIWRYLLR